MGLQTLLSMTVTLGIRESNGLVFAKKVKEYCITLAKGEGDTIGSRTAGPRHGQIHFNGMCQPFYGTY